MVVAINKKILRNIPAIFFAAMSAFTTCNLLFMYTQGSIFIDVLNILFLATSVISCLVMFIYGDYSKKERISLLASSLIAIIIFIMLGAHGSEMFVLIASLFMIKNIGIRKVSRIIYCSMLTVFLLYLFAAIVGLLPVTFDSKFNVLSSNSIDFMRIGGVHGNVAFVILFAIWSAFLYGFKVNKMRLLIGQLIIVICYFIFRSRTGLIICSLETIYYFINNVKFLNKRLLKIRKNKAVVWLEKHFIIMLALSPIIMSLLFYDTNTFNTLNSIFTSRFECTHSYIDAYGISIFPREVKLFTPLDNLYSYIFTYYGVLVYCAMLILVSRCTSKLGKYGKYDELFLLNIYGLYGMSERIIFKPACFVPILLFAILLYGRRYIIGDTLDLKQENSQNEK